MCRDITFAAAVNSLVSVFCYYIFRAAAAIIRASVFPGRSSSFRVYRTFGRPRDCAISNLFIYFLLHDAEINRRKNDRFFFLSLSFSLL
jgi:hypothetical protein